MYLCRQIIDINYGTEAYCERQRVFYATGLHRTLSVSRNKLLFHINIYYLPAKVQTIIEKKWLTSIFLPQNTEIKLLLGQNRVKKNWSLWVTYQWSQMLMCYEKTCTNNTFLRFTKVKIAFRFEIFRVVSCLPFLRQSIACYL